MWGAFGSLILLPWLLLARLDWDMDAVPAMTAAPLVSEVAVEVRDRAGMFGPGAERHAHDVLRRIHRERSVPVLIETIESLDGAWVADVARRRSQLAGPDRLYILLAEREREVGEIAARYGPASRLTDQQRESIRLAFREPLQAGDGDHALEQGARALVVAIDSARPFSPRFSGRDALISVTILVAAVAILIACSTWRGFAPRRGRFDLLSWFNAGTAQIPRTTAADDVCETDGKPRTSARRRQYAET